jgi:hypothetical protein
VLFNGPSRPSHHLSKLTTCLTCLRLKVDFLFCLRSRREPHIAD